MLSAIEQKVTCLPLHSSTAVTLVRGCCVGIALCRSSAKAELIWLLSVLADLYYSSTAHSAADNTADDTANKLHVQQYCS